MRRNPLASPSVKLNITLEIPINEQSIKLLCEHIGCDPKQFRKEFTKHSKKIIKETGDALTQQYTLRPKARLTGSIEWTEED